MNDAIEPIVEMLSAYKAAVYNKDVDAFAALYDDEVQVFDMWGAWACKGIKSWREMAVGWFDSLNTERVIVEVEEVHGHVEGDFAAGHAFLTFAAVSAEGTVLRSLNNRITLLMKKTGRSWKVVHEHTSAPVDSNTMKVILQRKRIAA